MKDLWTAERSGVLRRFGKISVLVGLVTALIAVITSCSSEGAGSDEGKTRTRVGQVSVQYPDDWVTSPAAERPSGWDWAAQNGSGGTGTVQLAVDGDYSALDVDFAAATLLGAAQVGSYPNFALRERASIEVSGATKAVRLDFSYRVGTVDYLATWVVARGNGTRTVVVQISGRKPLADELIAATINGMEVS
jgi:hypothetical protein